MVGGWPLHVCHSIGSRFGCMFVQQLMKSDSSEQTVPASLLHRVSLSHSSLSPNYSVYMYLIEDEVHVQ